MDLPMTVKPLLRLAAVSAVALLVAHGSGCSGSVTPEFPAEGTKAPVAADPMTASALSAEIAILAPFVEEYRGLKFASLPEGTLVDNFGGAPVEFSPEQASLFEALGWTDPGSGGDLASVYAEHVLGRYESGGAGQPGTLSIRSGPLTPFTRSLIVHELTHALDDQVYGLRSLPGESGLASTAVQEGSAMTVQHAWEATQPDDVRADIVRDRAAAESEFDQSPRAVRDMLTWPYVWGERYIAQVSSGDPTFRAAFTDRPRSAEEVMHGRQPAGVEVHPPASGAEVGRGPFGAAALFAVLGGSDGATFEWDGGEWVTWRDSNGSMCVTVDVATPPSSRDSTSDLLASSGFNITETGSRDTVRFSRCATG